jgi:hypothetical protein
MPPETEKNFAQGKLHRSSEIGKEAVDFFTYILPRMKADQNYKNVKYYECV